MNENLILQDLKNTFNWAESYMNKNNIDINNFGLKYQKGTNFVNGIDSFINEMQNKVYIPLTDMDFQELIFSSFSVYMGLNNKAEYSSDEVAFIVGIVILSQGHKVSVNGSMVETYSKVF